MAPDMTRSINAASVALPGIAYDGTGYRQDQRPHIDHAGQRHTRATSVTAPAALVR